MKLTFNKFDGGMTSEPRDPRENVCRSIVNFDNYTRPHKLTPFRSMKVDAVVESSLDNFKIQKMAVANGTLYGLGVVSSSDSHTQIYVKSSAGDPTSVWTTAPGVSTSAFSVELNVGFVLYHNYWYGGNTSGIWKYGDITSGSPTFTYNDYTAHTITAPGLVHSKYDIMYWPSGNLILQNDLHTGGGWSVGLTLPTDSLITSICEKENYLAIACNQPDGTSVVYLWDTQTTLNDLSEKIDWGNGSLKLIENIGGLLCGISTSSNDLTSINPKVMFKYYSGTRVISFQEFVCTLITIKSDKQRFNSLFYFLAEMTIDGIVYKGLWRIYKNPSGEMAISYDRNPRNDTALNSGSLHSFVRWGDYIFISYNNSTESDKFTIWRTDDQANYTATSSYNTVINPRMSFANGMRSNKKQILGVALATEPITVGQEAILRFKADGGSWIQAVTSATVGDVVKEGTFTTAGRKMKNAREYEFNIESTGGAEITEGKYNVEINQTQL